MVNGTQVGAITGVCCVVLIIAIALFAASWSVLTPLEMGLNRNDFSKSVDSKVYFSGRYFLGLGHSFVKYPRKLIIVDFSNDPEGDGGPPLDAGTADGQAIVLEVSVYYKLNDTQLPELYKLFNENYSDKLVRIAQSTLKNTAVLFNTTEYFTRRKEIAARMANNVDLEFRKVFASVVLLQLRGIGLPAGFEQRLVDNVVALQEQTKAVFEKQLAIVDAQTQVIEARAQGQITEILGQANADSLRIREQGNADGTRLLVDIEAESYKLLRSELGLTNEQLFQYLFYTRKLQQAKANDQLLVGLGDEARINIGGAIASKP